MQQLSLDLLINIRNGHNYPQNPAITSILCLRVIMWMKTKLAYAQTVVFIHHSRHKIRYDGRNGFFQ